MNFTLLYSKKETEKDTIYFRHRYSINGKPTEIKLKTNFKINRFAWDNDNECWDVNQKIKAARKEEDKLRNSEIDDFNLKFGNLKREIRDFIEDNPFPTKSEIKNILFGEKEQEAAYKQKQSEYPIYLCDFIDFYIQEKSKLIPGVQKPISLRTEQRYIQIKDKINKFYPKLKVTDIDDDFRNQYSMFMNKLQYKSSFIVRELKFIRTFCMYASKKLDINKDVIHWKFANTETNNFEFPIFSFRELQLINDKELPKESLNTARDWLLISCYTGQRVSDLLKMTSENIIDNEFYRIHQQKGQKDIVIWLMPQVMDILAKRNGEFPRKMSDQRYNEHIKKVAELAEIDKIMKGGKIENRRKVIKNYKKWELVTSHIGRRTFVSLFKNILGNKNIMTMTGHTTDAMVNLYDKTELMDHAKEVKYAYELSLKQQGVDL